MGIGEHPHSQADGSERERHLRLYGGNQMPFAYWNPWSWPTSARFAAMSVGTVVGFGAVLNFYGRRPWYAGGIPMAACAGSAAVLAWFAGNYRDVHYATRDAIVEHYKKLHPQDFLHLKPENQRRYNEILLPWYPIRISYSGKARPNLPIPEEDEATTT